MTEAQQQMEHNDATGGFFLDLRREVGSGEGEIIEQAEETRQRNMWLNLHSP